jgi:hypothetical protein
LRREYLSNASTHATLHKDGPPAVLPHLTQAKGQEYFLPIHHAVISTGGAFFAPQWRNLCILVPKKGLEPSHPCEYMDLNHARLPIPPLRLNISALLLITSRSLT